jgi:hypothetical protein
MKWLLIFLPLVGWGCIHLNDCKNQDCFTPPPDIRFELVDSATLENLFLSGGLPENPVSITDEQNDPIACTLNKQYSPWAVWSTELGWRMGSHHYTLTVGDSTRIRFTLDMEILETECCTFATIKSFTVDNYSYSGDPASGYVRVLIP